MKPEPITPEEQELERIWPERFAEPAAALAVHCSKCGKRTIAVAGVCDACDSSGAVRQRNWKERDREEKLARRRKVIEDFQAAAAGVPVAVGWKKQCTAVDSETGKRCTLLEHDPKVQSHNASGRPFKNPLAAGAQPRRELDRYARAGSDR